VFDLRIDHGAGPIDASYAYVVLPGMSARQTSRRASSLGVDILSNTAQMQACRHRGAGVTGMVFYEAGTVELAGLPRITVDRPCALLWRDLEDRVSLAAADPSHGIGTLTITVGEGMVLTYDLPEGLLAGRSVVEEFDLH
jgi:chondroitin AC lyase